MMMPLLELIMRGNREVGMLDLVKGLVRITRFVNYGRRRRSIIVMYRSPGCSSGRGMGFWVGRRVIIMEEVRRAIVMGV
jgi:hypothetical protein